MVLLSSRGYSARQIAVIFDPGEDVVRLWLHRCRQAAEGPPGSTATVLDLCGRLITAPYSCWDCCRTPSAVRRTSSEGLRGVLVCPFVAQIDSDAWRGQAADGLPGHIAEFGNRPLL